MNRSLASPWAYFLLFAAANAVLAYGLFDPWLTVCASFLGLALPLASLLMAAKREPAAVTPFYLQEAFPASSTWLWALLSALAIAIRLAQTHVPGYWPGFDDGLAYYSVELSHKWSWNFFFTKAQHPPLFNWLLALFFKIFSPSLFTLLLYPALFSIAAFALGCVLSRALFSGSLAFFCCVLMAFGFWPLFTGKFCLYMVFLVFWEMAALLILLLFLKEPSPGKSGKILTALSLCVAAGFWVDITWPVVALAVMIPVYTSLTGRRGRFFWFLVPVLSSAAVFAGVSIRQGNGAHIQMLWGFQAGMEWKNQIRDSFSNFTALFWGCDPQNSYGPVWGGVLNPLWGASFFMGAVECVKLRKDPLVRWIGGSFLLMSLPGFLCRNFDLFRNVQALPFLLVITAFGMQSVLLSLRGRGGRRFFYCALLLAVGLDLRHVWMTYDTVYSPAGQVRNVRGRAESRVFEILRGKSEASGPGALLFDLRANVADQTLGIATYSFNAARNPDIPSSRVKWAAVLVDAHYQPFLEKRFGDGEWFRIFPSDQAGYWPGDKWLLGIVPIGPERGETRLRWMKADEEFRGIIWEAANTPSYRGRGDIFKKLPGIYPSVQGDPLLESLYWEMVYEFHAWENIFGDRNTPVHYPAAFRAVRNAIQDGYPTAVFYEKLGDFLVFEKKYGEARVAFMNAVHSPLNYTQAAERLKMLDEMKGK